MLRFPAEDDLYWNESEGFEGLSFPCISSWVFGNVSMYPYVHVYSLIGGYHFILSISFHWVP